MAELPVASLALPRDEAKPTSKRPAIIKIIQFIDSLFYFVYQYKDRESEGDIFLQMIKNKELVYFSARILLRVT